MVSLFPLESAGYANRGEAYYKMGQEEKALHDLTMVSLLEAEKQSIPERVQQLLSQLETSIGSRLARAELARRARDGDFVAFSSPFHSKKLPPPTKAACISRLAFYSSERSAAYNPDHLDLVTLTKRISDFSAGSSPSLGDLYLMRGGLLKSEKMFLHAAEDFAKAAEPASGCSQPFNALLETATFRCLCGDNAGARALFAELATMAAPGSEPNWENFYAKYATCLVSLDMKEALRVSGAAVEKFPSSAEMRLVRGFVLQSAGNTAEAMRVGKEGESEE